MTILQTESLCKSFGEYQVLRNVEFSIDSGQLVGFLGPNGAGKSTTIRILMGLLSSSSGSATVFGMPVDIDGKRIRSRVGYLPGDVNLYTNLTGSQFLRFFMRARRVDCQVEARRLAMNLDLDLNKNVRKYSTGMRQKLGLIQALMHKPELLVLDEPTSALDPLVRARVFEELRRVTSEGRTVLFSSHSLDEVESLCDEVIILRGGRVVEQQKIEALKNRALRKVQIFASQLEPLNRPENLKIFEESDEGVTGTWSGDIRPLLRWIENLNVEDLIIERPDLNDLFISYYSEQDENDR